MKGSDPEFNPLTLVLIRGSFSLSLMGGGGDSFHTIFISENNRKSNKITHCVEFFFRSSFEVMGIFCDR